MNIARSAVRSRRVAIASALSILTVASFQAVAAGVRPLVDFSRPEGGPFPSDVFTGFDLGNLTYLRMSLPAPDCTQFPSDCDTIARLNELDGFGLQPRLSVPFSGAIEPNTVTSSTMFLVNLGDVRGGRGFGQVVGINQIVWDPVTNTLYAESDEQLRQHTRYLLVLTDGIRDPAGQPVQPAAILRDAPQWISRFLPNRARLVAASIFTTQSATAVLEKIRDQIKASVPASANFAIATKVESDGTKVPRQPARFNLSDLPIPTSATDTTTTQGIALFNQTGHDPTVLTSALYQLWATNIVPGAVGRVAFGSYSSPDYRNDQQVIPAVPTRTGIPQRLRSTEVFFTVFLPAGTPPRGGWPVVIGNHGIGGSRHAELSAAAAHMAHHGFALIGINAVGHGFGPEGILRITKKSGDVYTVPNGGRAVELNGDRGFGPDEGMFTPKGPNYDVASRDGLRQTVIDHMQLVRLIEAGIDVDGDGMVDLDPSRIYYFGVSQGGIVGTIFLAVEPSVYVGVPVVPGGPSIDAGRLSPALRANRVVSYVKDRTPSLLNGAADFNENIPLRTNPPVPRPNDVAGAIEIQTLFDRLRWLNNSSNPVAYAPHLRERPLDGMPAKNVIILFARGDLTIPNPTTTALIRAGNLADQATYYRYDKVFDALKGVTPTPTAAQLNAARNPHNFFLNLTAQAIFQPILFAQRDAVQEWVARFFETDGLFDPNGPDGGYFEAPIVPPVPETVNPVQ